MCVEHSIHCILPTERWDSLKYCNTFGMGWTSWTCVTCGGMHVYLTESHGILLGTIVHLGWGEQLGQAYTYASVPYRTLFEEPY